MVLAPSQPRWPWPKVLATMGLAAAVVLLAVLFAGAAGVQALTYLPSLNLEEPPLSKAHPIVGAPPPRRAQRVILVVVDGLRLDASYGRPFFDALRRRGVSAKARSHFPTLSRPNYASIALGIPPKWSGVRTNDYNHPAPFDSLLARVHAAGLSAAYVSDISGGFPRMFGHHLAVGMASPWPGFFESAARTALAGDYDLVILLPSGPDVAGHAHGAASPEYREAVRETDAMLGRVLAGLDYQRDAVVVVSDHGHVDRGGHGGLEPEVTDVPLLLAGAGIARGATVVDAHLIDIAPTVAALLGVPAPGHAVGRTLTEALDIPASDRAALIRADATRRERLLPQLEELAALDRATAFWSRVRRGGAALALLAGLVLAALLLARRRILVVDRRVAVLALPAFPTMFYGLTLAFEGFLSPSTLPDGGFVLRRLFLYGAVAATAHVVGAWFALSGRAPPTERLAAATGLAFVGLLVALAPAGAAWALSGRPLAVTLPDPAFALVPPVTYAAVCCYALAAAAMLAVEYVVFLARATDPRPFRATS